MNTNNLCGGGRGAIFVRFGAVLVLIILLFVFYDTWLPRARGAYEGFKSGVPPPDSSNHDTTDTSSDLPGTTPSPLPIHDADESLPDFTNETCRHLPGADKIMVLLKTGATELYQKLPVHFVTTFKCVPKYMIFSDLEQEFGGVKIHDAIAPVTKKRRKEHEDFRLYRDIDKWWKEGQDMSLLKGDSGWNLDKWKFLPMFHMAFEQADNNIEWFFMMEADTSISWLNLLLWIQTLDSTKPYYMGAQTMLGETVFGHGGSGVLISRAAADKLQAARDDLGHEKYDEAWEEETAVTCCGDAILARAFLAIDIPLTGSWPIIQGETISTVDFTHNHWCQPPVTWHHVHPIQIDAMYQFEESWTTQHSWEKPYLYRDVFAHFVAPHITTNRTKWNNVSKDHKYVSPNLNGMEENSEYNDGKRFDELEKWEQASVESISGCAEACSRRSADDCKQWMYQVGRCYLGRDVRYGQSDERESEHWDSGWMQERIEEFLGGFDVCEPNWINS